MNKLGQRVFTAEGRKRWPYRWTHTSGAHGNATTSDALTYAQFARQIDRWNYLGGGQWRYYEGHQDNE